MTIVAVEGSLSLTVIDKAEGVVVVFGGKYAPETARAGKAEGVVGGKERSRGDVFRWIPYGMCPRKLFL